MISKLARPILSLSIVALTGSLAFAQAPAQPPAPAAPAAQPAPIQRQAPPMRPGMMQGRGQMMQGHGPQMMHNHGNFHGGPQEAGAMGPFHIAPGGMWWKNPMVVQRISLTADQSKKMDDIFEQSRLDLIDKKAAVEKAQVMLEPLLSANPLDTAKAQAQVDRVANARADLEKANAHMLLGIRAVLTPDQWTKLNTRQFGPNAASGAQPGSGGPNGQSGPGGPGGSGRGRGMRTPPPAASNLVNPIDLP